MSEPRTCPKCDGCDHGEPQHHWDFSEKTLTGIFCAHCEAMAVECCECDGSGIVDIADVETKQLVEETCSACNGQRIVEVVAISHEEVDRLRAVNVRLLAEVAAFEAQLRHRLSQVFHV